MKICRIMCDVCGDICHDDLVITIAWGSETGQTRDVCSVGCSLQLLQSLYTDYRERQKIPVHQPDPSDTLEQNYEQTVV